ncbi:MAG: hypothetical protein M3Y51_03895 [Actinomycetota bacterium]|nr:hypothetical protein [Actinomycetota bacterium]
MARVLVALAAIVLGSLELWLCWAGSQRRLPAGGPLGIPLGSVRRSDEAWYAAHEAAAGAFGLGGGVAAICGMAVLVNGLDVIGVALSVVAAVALVAGAVAAAIVGSRAAATL